MIPEIRRVAVHQAGHAVVQALVGRGRFTPARVTLGVEYWRGLAGCGEAALDQEVSLGLYEFGLVTMAGIAAEQRYLELGPPATNPLVALSDLAEWREEAWKVLQNHARARLVGLNVMRRLQQWMADGATWQVIEQLADELLATGSVEGARLQGILAPLTGGAARKNTAAAAPVP
ncbi:hypothetical protein DESUT3_32630 [Desulfuromonas versatilis]|uniref:Peptidase M41 domain-containing protein n=1 Tax=Desulfuromonas versatilis TaxID=2802975 RepID=A0ABN6E1P4_9BACT|nr:hypothetical protein [Desulfuromonas versatilis]BCR06194.1 hypothetical protein DESUT3_32630 [Desulfuromonas versatilis]